VRKKGKKKKKGGSPAKLLDQGGKKRGGREGKDLLNFSFLRAATRREKGKEKSVPLVGREKKGKGEKKIELPSFCNEHEHIKEKRGERKAALSG